MIKEFKDFISRGNVLDLAVGVIIGSAFTSIVNSLVTNLLNPFLGKIDLSNLILKVGGASFKFGSFINSIINFLIIAFVVFLIVKSVNKLMPKPEKKPAGPTPEQEYLREIRDLLKNK